METGGMKGVTAVGTDTEPVLSNKAEDGTKGSQDRHAERKGMKNSSYLLVGNIASRHLLYTNGACRQLFCRNSAVERYTKTYAT